MARRVTRAAGRAAPAAPIAPITMMPLDKTLPAGGLLRTGHTGRFLVSMEPSDTKEAAKALESGAGLKLMSFSSHPTESSALDHIPINEGLVFHDLGVAVVNAAPDQVMAVNATVASASSLKIVEPERYVHAIASGIDQSYLLGYRDAVNQLVDSIVGAPAGPTRSTPLVAAASALDETSLSWGLQATNVAASRYTGKGIRVAVLDTGLDFTHPDFAGRARESRSFIEDIASAQDGNGHGTHCAGVVGGPVRPMRLPRFGVAPDAELLIGKVLSDAGGGTDKDIIAGIQWALSSKCDIVSMSLGAPVPDQASFSQIYEQIAQRALARNCVIIAAAGNDSFRPQSVRPVSHPANCPSIFAVAAIDREMQATYFSNAGLNPDGGQIDVAAPGLDIVSTWVMPEAYKAESGTSMATPHVAGIAALIAEANPGVRGHALFALLMQRARRLAAASADVGAGLAQAP